MDQENEMNRVYLVTGATGAIGQAISRQLATGTNHEVILVGRDETKTRRITEQIIAATGNAMLRYEIADLSRHESITALADRWSGPLHVLVNNAGTTPRSRQETPEGIELQFATNVLGYFWMTRALEPFLIRSAPARVINVASYWAGDLEIDDLEFIRRGYDNGRAYRQSKQANRMLTAAFSRRLKPLGISVNACHPGDVSSRLSNDLGFGGHESADQGADTPVWLATDPIGHQMSGAYFEHRRATTDHFAQDVKAVEALYQACLVYGKV